MPWDTQNTFIGTKLFAPSFKYGGYIEQPYTRPFTVQEIAEVEQILTEMEDSRQNCVYLRVNSADTSTQQIVESCSAKGIKIILEPNDSNGEQAIFDKFGTAPFAAILNKDDQGGAPLDECIARYNYLKENFPTFPVYSTGEFTTQEALERRGWADIVAQQNYQSGRPDTVSTIVNLYRSGRIANKPFMANPQSFIGYEGVFPPAEEMYAYGLLALMFCDAICWYTYYDAEAHNILDYPEHWLAIKQLSTEINDNENTIIHGERSLHIDPDKVRCEWTYQGAVALSAEVRTFTNPTITGSLA